MSVCRYTNGAGAGALFFLIGCGAFGATALHSDSLRRHTGPMVQVSTARHLVRARDLADARYADALSVADMAAAAGLSRAHFSRAFRRTFGESPHQ